MSAPDPTRQQDQLRRMRPLSIAAAVLAVLALANVIGVIVFSDTDQGPGTSPLPTASKPPATSTVPSAGTFCCVPAGGERSAWSAGVSFRGATDGVLVIVASTGGHYQGVEQFTVTAVRLRD